MRRRIKGKVKTLSLETSDRKLAERKLHQETEKLRNISTEKSLKECCEAFLSAKANAALGTQKTYKWVISHYEKSTLWIRPVHKIYAAELVAFIASRWPDPVEVDG